MLWALRRAGPGPRAVVFEYDPSRSGRVAERLLDDFRGTVVTDGFDGYKRLAVKGITRAACWAHVRRKFVEAVEIEGKAGTSTVAKQAVELIGRLYDVERQAKEMSAEARLTRRQTEAKTIMGEIEAALDAQIGRLPPKSPTGRALSYLRDEWFARQVYQRDDACRSTTTLSKTPPDLSRSENRGSASI